VESERDAGDQPDLGVDRFDQCVGPAVLEGGVDVGPDQGEPLGEVDEGGDAAAAGPGQPVVQGVFTGLAFDGEDEPEAFFEQVGAVQAGIGLGDPGQLCRVAGR
jgi:hypothetical protein